VDGYSFLFGIIHDIYDTIMAVEEEENALEVERLNALFVPLPTNLKRR
jgi:hypothetical protein